LTSSSAPDSVVHLVRRIIDVDRQMGVHPKGAGPWSHRFAFIDGSPQGRGTENSYSLENVVALWLGIQFLALGVPQAESVRFIRALKVGLDQAVRPIHDNHAERIAAAVTHKGESAEKLRRAEFLVTGDQVYVLTATVDHHGVITAATRRGRSTLSNIC